MKKQAVSKQEVKTFYSTIALIMALKHVGLIKVDWIYVHAMILGFLCVFENECSKSNNK